MQNASCANAKANMDFTIRKMLADYAMIFLHACLSLSPTFCCLLCDFLFQMRPLQCEESEEDEDKVDGKKVGQRRGDP